MVTAPSAAETTITSTTTTINTTITTTITTINNALASCKPNNIPARSEHSPPPPPCIAAASLHGLLHGIASEGEPAVPFLLAHTPFLVMDTLKTPGAPSPSLCRQ